MPSSHLAVRMGLGYVGGGRVEDVRGIVAERERRGPFRSIADLAARCGAGLDSLERLAWAGACDRLVRGGRREALWLLGVSPHGVSVPSPPATPLAATPEATAAVTQPTRSITGRRIPRTEGEAPVQLALPFDPVDAPALRPTTRWERLLADYGSTKVTLADHPLALMRSNLEEDVLSSSDLHRARDGATVRVAGLVVARQRPATAKGVTFMLLEDEHGTINLVVPPPVHDRCRLAVRAEPFVLGVGKLERREGVVNVVVSAVWRLDHGDVPPGEIRHIEPQRTWSTEDASGDLRAVAPNAHSFGRRG
jgi:error-prone DNA polymerase